MRSITITPTLITWKGGPDHLLTLRVTYDRKSHYYPVLRNHQKVRLTQKDFDALTSRRVPVRLDEVRKALANQRERFEAVNLEQFTFEAFEAKITHRESSVFINWEAYAVICGNEGRINTANGHRASLRLLKEYRRGRDLDFIDLTKAVVRNFEVWMMQTKKLSGTSVGIHLRNLRTIVNREREVNPALPYPFAKFAIRTGSGRRGDALNEAQLKKLIAGPDSDARDYFLFSFYAQGMNFADLALLRYENIKGREISYHRKKTARTQINGRAITVPLTDTLRKLIIKLGNPEKSGFVFPILTEGMAEPQRVSRVRNFTGNINRRLQTYCKRLKLPPITTYWARHSYATMLRNIDVNEALISESLGHSNVQVTQHYLKAFELDKRMEVAKKLLKALK